ncbi:MAG TPA: hypothetical protein VMS37_32550 [Verrucomicrobiae bacterium]|nr:hypothetical protein [Verrucomicrobiae bacterium]
MKIIVLLILAVLAASAQVPYQQTQGQWQLTVSDWTANSIPGLDGRVPGAGGPTIKGMWLTACTTDASASLGMLLKSILVYRSGESAVTLTADFLEPLSQYGAIRCANTILLIPRTTATSLTVAAPVIHWSELKP